MARSPTKQSPNQEVTTKTSCSRTTRLLLGGSVLGCLVTVCLEDLILAPLASWKNFKSPTQLESQEVITTSSRPIYDIPDDQMRSTIRKWGCHRTETPFVFVHIGKAGGGSVRARIAASAVNYTKGKLWSGVDDSYYPIDEKTRARFCSSCFSSRRPSKEKTFEGTVWCHATTPIGRAIACPEGWDKGESVQKRLDGECNTLESDTCRVVYVGHNWMGAEFHWLPHQYLENWWNDLQRPTPSIPWHRLHKGKTWCDAEKAERPPNWRTKHLPLYETCSIPLAREVDVLSKVALSPRHDGIIESWAPLYASLPVLRVTVLRDPFSWLMSKFFWHRHDLTLTCDNITQAIGGNVYDIPRRQQFKQNGQPGWVPLLCLYYIMFLCGEDCATRYAAGQANLADLERQAEENLRHSFAVVGILEELDDFFDMINARVKYLDTTLNLDFKVGGKHGTSKQGEAARCKERFQDPQFQNELLEASPELSAVYRLYQVGKQVKNFQKKELQQCSPSSFPSK